MKKCLLKFPIAKSEFIAEFIGSNNIVNLLSWVESSGLFDDHIKCWIAFPEDKSDKVRADLGIYIQNTATPK